MSGPAQPWEQQPGEPSEAFAAFKSFRDAGPGRSLDAAYRAGKGRPGRAPGNWRRWAKTQDWERRARAWDHRLDRVETDARQQVVAAAAGTDQERQQQQRQQEQKLVAALFDKAMAMLAFPLATRKVVGTGDDPTTIISPAKWSFGDAVRAGELAAKLGRILHQMPGTAPDRPATEPAAETVIRFRPVPPKPETPQTPKPETPDAGG